MLKDRFGPIDAEYLNDKADSLTVRSDEFVLFADPREDKTPYAALMQMKDASSLAVDDGGGSPALRLARRLGRAMAVDRILGLASK